MKKVSFVAAAAILATGVTPLAAADLSYGSGSQDRRVAAFAGANVRIPLGAKAGAKLSARLQLTTVHSYQDRYSAAPARTYRSPGLELGLSAKKPAIFMMGQDVAKMQQKLGIGGSTSTLLIVGGVAIAALAVYLITDECDACKARPAN